jgi:hypothetical protein
VFAPPVFSLRRRRRRRRRKRRRRRGGGGGGGGGGGEEEEEERRRRGGRKRRRWRMEETKGPLRSLPDTHSPHLDIRAPPTITRAGIAAATICPQTH